MTDRTDTRPARRRFFGLLAATGAATAAASAVLAAKAGAMTPAPDKSGARYRESEHVKTYYRVNRS